MKKKKTTDLSQDVVVQPSHIRLYEFNEKFIELNGCAPTLQQAADDLKISRQNVFRILCDLRTLGCVEIKPGRTRGVTLVKSPRVTNKK